MSNGLRNAAAIVAEGMHVVGEDQPRISSLELQLHACQRAMAAAGIDRRDVGAVFTGRAPMSFTAMEWNMRIITELKIVPKLSSEITIHGAGVLATWQYAAMAVANGLVEYALCCSGCMGRRWVDLVKVNAGVESDLQFEMPYGPTTPSLYALWAQRYMHEFGVVPADTAPIAVENRRWALAHPDAAMRRKGPITVEDVLASPLIASPLRLLDCSSWYMGGGVGSAVVITSAERARDTDRPVYISGFGQCTTHEWVTDRLGLFGIEPPVAEPNLVTTRQGEGRGRRNARMALAGMTPGRCRPPSRPPPRSRSSIHDHASKTWGSASEKGEGKGLRRGRWGSPSTAGCRSIRTGAISVSGQGGEWHAHGARSPCSSCAPRCVWARQVPDARNGLVHFHGGPNAAHSVILLVPRRTTPDDHDWSEGLPFMIGPYELGLTETSPETAGFWEGVASGELRIKRCANCGRHLHPRRIFCLRSAARTT